MNGIRISLAALLGLLVALPARGSDGVVDLSWHACSPIFSDVASVPEGGSVSLFASVVGHDVPHKAYDVHILYGNGSTLTVPDAWRFDLAGCQGVGGGAMIDHLSPLKACPSFQGTLQSLQIKDVNFMPPAVPYPATLMRIVLANAYPAGNFTAVNPLQRYFLARVRFDHLKSVDGPTVPGTNCGGLSTPMCFSVYDANYVDMQGLVFPFSLTGNRSLTVGGAQPYEGCSGPVPAQAATWGQIKSQYRN